MAQRSLLNITWDYKISVRKPIPKLLKSVSEYLSLDAICCRLKFVFPFFCYEQALLGKGVIRKLGKQRNFDILRLNWKDTSWQGAHFMLDKVLHKYWQLSLFPSFTKSEWVKVLTSTLKELWSVFCISAKSRLVYTYLWIHQ